MNPFRDLVGSWAGACAFRLMPEDELSSADSAATSAVEAAGWGWSLRYTWVHPEDGEQSGLLLVASPDDDGAITAAWLDSWHQKPSLQSFSGTVDDGMVDLAAEYAPGWTWRISVGPGHGPQAGAGRELRMVMHNVVPAGRGDFAGAYVVMDASWRDQPPA